jgi:BirA family biotin operon repressor/biotin-[acetyl-CoA-carboxylase] ligase
VKWPNDIFVETKKVGGLLLEVARSGNNIVSTVLGIGMNILSTPRIENGVYGPTCLREESTLDLDFEDVVIKIIQTLVDRAEKFKMINAGDFCNKWKTFDSMYGKTIDAQMQERSIRGTERGINEKGELLLLQSDGLLVKIPTGEAKIFVNGQL